MSLEERLARLEREAHRLRNAVAGCAIVIVLLGATALRPAPQASDVLKARRFELVNQYDSVVGSWQASDSSQSLTMGGQELSPRVTLFAGVSTSFMMLNSENGSFSFQRPEWIQFETAGVRSAVLKVGDADNPAELRLRDAYGTVILRTDGKVVAY